MQSWKWIVLWVIVAALVFSFAVCQKKVEQEKDAGTPEAAELSSVPEKAAPVKESEPAEKPVEATSAPEKEPEKEAAPAEEKSKMAAQEPKEAEPAKPAEAAPAKPVEPAKASEAAPVKPVEPVTRDNAAAIIEMKKGGRIVIEFYPEDAPNTVDNFIKLTNKGFYDGLKFHRVEPGLLVQGGCPQGTGYGGPGYQIKAEFNSQRHVAGTVAMARSEDPDSAGSQFYICLTRLSSLDRNYTVFGQVIEGMDVVNGIARGDVMKKVTIVHKDSVKK